MAEEDLNTQARKALGGNFSEKEIAKIKDFLERGFSPGGIFAIISIFFYAKENEKTVDEVLEQCKDEWERNWQYQHPDLRGSPDAPGGAGNQNRISLTNIYNALEIPNPYKEETENIPEGEFTARTENSVYHFGEADESGERTLVREGRPLRFSRGKILFLSEGKRMKIKIVDDPKGGAWETSPIVSIEV